MSSIFRVQIGLADLVGDSLYFQTSLKYTFDGRSNIRTTNHLRYSSTTLYLYPIFKRVFGILNKFSFF
jgi:hypothetical protein